MEKLSWLDQVERWPAVSPKCVLSPHTVSLPRNFLYAWCWKWLWNIHSNSPILFCRWRNWRLGNGVAKAIHFFFFLNQAIVPFTVSLRWKDCKGLLPRHPVPVRVWMGGQHKQEGRRGDASFHLLQFKGTGCSVLPQPKTQEAKWTVTQAGSRYTQITVATLGLTVHTAHTRLKRGWSKGEICVWAVAMNTSGRAWWL